MRISDEILNRLVEAYRRVRNTARFLISNLYDFDPAKDRVPAADLDELDRWILQRTENLLSRCRDAYEKCEFHVVYHSVNNFCAVDLSAQYLDIVKDRLYCEGTNSTKRRAAQTALYRILDVLVHLTAPILSFTAEEIWNYLPDKAERPKSVFLSHLPEADTKVVDAELGERWERIFRERGEVLKALEQARSAGIIGHSLDAKVVFAKRGNQQSAKLSEWVNTDRARLQDLLIVSQADNGGETAGRQRFSGKLRRATAQLRGPSQQSRRRQVRTLLEVRCENRRRPQPSDRLPALRRGIERRSGGLSGKWKNISGWLAAIVILDQLTKVIVDRTMALYQSIPIVDGLFSFTYVRNTGAAFGIFAGSAADLSPALLNLGIDPCQRLYRHTAETP